MMQVDKAELIAFKYDVYLCSYNAERNIEQVIYSIEQQTIKPRTINVFDDNSDDNTQMLLMKLQKQIEENKERVRELKRADSEIRLQMAVKQMNSDEEKDKVEILRACYDYIAQHRLMFSKKSLKKTPLPITGAY